MFPSMDAFGGWGGLMGLRPRQPPQPLKLSQLNRLYQRFPDTFPNDYASLLRNPDTGADLGALTKPIVRVPDPCRVGLVGGGIGNLVAAYELARCGVVPTIFEATGLLGGRMHTHLFNDGESAELGAMRIPDNSKLFWHYFAHYWADFNGEDVVLKPFPNPGTVPTHVNWQNSVSQLWNEPPYNGASTLPPIFEKIGEDFWRRILEHTVPTPHGDTYFTRVHDILRQGQLSEVDQAEVEAYWSSCIANFEQRAFGSVIADKWLTKQGVPVQWGPNEISAFAALGLGTGGFGALFGVSFLEILRLLLWDYAGEYALPETTSMSLFADWFQKAIYQQVEKLHVGKYKPEDLFKLSTPVDKVVVSGDPGPRKVELTAGGEQYLFDYAIVGMTQRAMQKLGLDRNGPGSWATGWLPFSLNQPASRRQRHVIESVQAGLRWTNVMSSSKTFVRIPQTAIDSTSWPSYNYPADPTRHRIEVTLTDKNPRACYWLPATTGKSYAAVLVSYTWGNDSNKLEALSGKERGDAFVNAIDEMSSIEAFRKPYEWVAMNLGESNAGSVMIDWQSQQYHYGAFKLDQPGDYYYTSSLAFHYLMEPKPDEECNPASMVFLTGDSVSFLGGWIEGAMMSGINAATAILHSVGEHPRSATLLAEWAMPFHFYRHIGGGAATQDPQAPTVETTVAVAQ